jgi:hypothetical protein
MKRQRTQKRVIRCAGASYCRGKRSREDREFGDHADKVTAMAVRAIVSGQSCSAMGVRRPLSITSILMIAGWVAA